MPCAPRRSARCSGVAGGCFLCYLRRKKRKLLQMQNRKYTPYGEADDEGPGLHPAGPDCADVIDPDEKL